jgi:ribosomal protein L35
MQSHNLEHKSAKRKRAFRRDQPVAPADVRELSRLFPGMVKKKKKVKT